MNANVSTKSAAVAAAVWLAAGFLTGCGATQDEVIEPEVTAHAPTTSETKNPPDCSDAALAASPGLEDMKFFGSDISSMCAAKTEFGGNGRVLSQEPEFTDPCK